MNLVLLFPEDFVAADRVVLRGRRREHIEQVHRAAVGDELVVGLANGNAGAGIIDRLTADEVEIRVSLDWQPPPPLPLTLVIALPRPKVLNRLIAGATSLGVKQIFLINSWRVEKSYWKSPRLGEANLRQQAVAGLEQARDTVMPDIQLRRLFRPFVEGELPAVAHGTAALVAHPKAVNDCPRQLSGAITLAIGPEGGFIDREVESLERIGFRSVSLGPRVLRVETALAALVSRLT